MIRAVILAGGRGTRLRPYTISLPKPLMPIGDKPILEIIIGQLAAQGIEHITLAVSHQAEILQAYFSDGSKWKELHDRIEAARTLVAVQHEAAS